MDKQEFLVELREGLSGLPQGDIEERLAFYSEMIDDLAEDGLSEEAAVEQIGPVDATVQQIVAEIPLPKLVMERIRPKRRLQVWEIVFLIVGAPVWFPLLIAAFAVLFSVFIVIWAVILSLWAVECAFVFAALGAAAAGVLTVFQADVLRGVIMLSAAAVLAGLSILLFFGCRAAGRGALILTRKCVRSVKSLFWGKENMK